MKTLLLRALEEACFDPDVDYVTLTGSVHHLTLCYAWILAHYHRVKTLMFDSRRSLYVERTVTG